MSRDFSIGVRFVSHVSYLEPLSFFCEGVGAMLFILGLATGLKALALAGIVTVAAAVLALLAHLGQPLRAWRAITRPQAAWVSRGTLVIGGFLGASCLWVLVNWTGVLQSFEPLLRIASLALAILVIIYAGMLLRSMRAVRLWRGPFVPVSFCAHSIASGLVVAWAAAQWLDADLASLLWLRVSGILALFAAAVFSGVHLALAERSTGVNASLQRLLQGDLRSGMQWGAAVCGLLVPLIALLVVTPGTGAGVLLAIAAIARLYGDFVYRSSMVTAGAYEPVAPPGALRAARLSSG